VNKLISILLPNLNNRPFLDERIESIYKQTLSEWELVIVDSYSEDGAWEFFKDLASRDDRVKISQAPRQGVYAGWNECIRQAEGRYVYFATSDDIMANDCLEKMYKALDEHSECGLAHCPLKLFDQDSKEIKENWWEYGLFAQSSGDYIHRRHIRKAPFDGLLHLSGSTVYISITQLLIRKNLFVKTGLFPTDRGSKGDFQWDMMAALITDTIHVPDTWGGWRIHSKQATAVSNRNSPEHWQFFEAMVLKALKEAEPSLDEPAHSFIQSSLAISNVRKNRIRAEFGSQTEFMKKLGYILTEARKYPVLISELIADKIRSTAGLQPRRDPCDYIRFLKNCGFEPNLIPVDEE
jgi:glycosyltransferase involved in cell wall biosynthesis